MEFGTDPYKLVRKEDPDTSHKSADIVDSTKLEAMVYACIKGFGSAGCISDQILAQFPHYPYSSITARYRALLDRGYIEDTGQRRPGRSGRGQRIMRAV